MCCIHMKFLYMIFWIFIFIVVSTALKVLLVLKFLASQLQIFIKLLLYFSRKRSNKTIQPPVLNFSAKNTKLLIPMKQYVNSNNLHFPPFRKAVWYQTLFLIKNQQCYIVTKFLLQTVPSYIMDSILIMFCKKPR